ncbi:MAG: hypothetical protein WKF40_03005 [Thermoleophilaceae bacterium]
MAAVGLAAIATAVIATAWGIYLDHRVVDQTPDQPRAIDLDRAQLPRRKGRHGQLAAALGLAWRTHS